MATQWMQIASLTIVLTISGAGARHRAIVAAKERHVYMDWGTGVA
jgi:hypothetical protein